MADQLHAKIEKWLTELSAIPSNQRLTYLKGILSGIDDDETRKIVSRNLMLSLNLGNQFQKALQVVVLVHGIRTHASWQEKVAVALRQLPNVKVVPIGYDYFDAIRFWCPLYTRRTPVQRVLRELRSIQANHNGDRVSVIAHSFGTYIISKILKDESDIRLSKLLMCGSVVPTMYRWDLIANKPQLGILNDVGMKDLWPLIAKASSWGYGPSGTFGFKTEGVRDRFNDLGHSDFFEMAHISEFWVPFIATGEIVNSPTEANRNTPSALYSLLAFFPIKSFVALIIICAVWWFAIAPNKMGI